ncbi:MAG: hypothetical protein ACR2GE_01870 [Pseudonocardia sp.]
MSQLAQAADAGSSFAAIVESAARAAATLVGDAASWWAVPSAPLQQPAVLGAQNALRPLLALVLIAAVLVQAIRIILLRRGEPVIAVASGLLRFAVAAALGITVLQGALWAGDALASTLLGDSAADFGALMKEALTKRDGIAEPFLLLLLSVAVLLLAGAHWMAMALRQVGLLVIAATLPLAAAGSLTASTRGWLTRLVPWAAALVLYKPAAALVHTLGNGYLRSTAGSGGAAGTGLGTVLVGIVVLAVGVAMLPALLRLTSWSSLRITGRSVGATAPFMAGAAGAVNLTGRTRTAAAVQLAAYMDDAGPGSRRRSTTTPALLASGAVSAPARPAELATSGRRPAHAPLLHGSAQSKAVAAHNGSANDSGDGWANGRREVAR